MMFFTILAILCVGLFAGAAIYITAVEHPARLACGPTIAVNRDVVALTDQTTFLSNKINFLLDTTLGLINIEQNQIIKIFSVAAVVFLPHTLGALISGMNFEYMPERKWLLGFPWANG